MSIFKYLKGALGALITLRLLRNLAGILYVMDGYLSGGRVKSDVVMARLIPYGRKSIRMGLPNR